MENGMRRWRLAALAATLLGGVFLVAGCSSGGGEKLALTAQNISWSNSNLQLKANTKYTVTVTNKDSVEHNFTFQDAKANKDVEKGEDAKITFTTPGAGSFKFFCKYHPAKMTGTVTVA
jgi:plastocyanin